MQHATYSLPNQLIDFSRFLNGNPQQRLATAREILHGFQTAGFIYLKNHPIPADTVQHAFARSADFFALDDEAKLKLKWTTAEANRGYSSPGREKVTQLLELAEVEKVRDAAPDLKESLEIGRDTDPEFPNQWPDEDDVNLRGFRTDMVDFFGRCQVLHADVMRAIALAMGLEQGFFDQYVDVGDNTLRLLHYPGVKADVFKVNPGQVRAGEHSVSCCCPWGKRKKTALRCVALRLASTRCATVKLMNALISSRTTARSRSSSRMTGAACRSSRPRGSSSTPRPFKTPLSSTPATCWPAGATIPSRAPYIEWLSHRARMTSTRPDTALRECCRVSLAPSRPGQVH